MGGGIAQVTAQIAKIPVIVVDKDANKLQAANKLWGTELFQNY
jgi:3-hydroxyacyl-CoA dehydrogenase